MTTQVASAPLPTLMQRLAAAFRPMHARGALFAGPAHPPAGPGAAAPRTSAPQLDRFVAQLRELLAATDETARRRLEREVLELAAPLQAAGVFDLLRIAHAPLAAMVADHLAASAGEPRHPALG
ncbi:hypothetical protein [Dyella lutea]|uniref:Uncharacterized protein n=1 Tax=Dyella lutea TaxID=2950441 RepID=A0ABT1FEE7_9GAMM|nr:hypothetical protein [Dyella lutea]MCP1375750.1 hypothetical protein [Dyella lutea]